MTAIKLKGKCNGISNISSHPDRNDIGLFPDECIIAPVMNYTCHFILFLLANEIEIHCSRTLTSFIPAHCFRTTAWTSGLRTKGCHQVAIGFCDGKQARYIRGGMSCTTRRDDCANRQSLHITVQHLHVRWLAGHPQQIH